LDEFEGASYKMALGTATDLKSNADAVIGTHISMKIKATFRN